ncbi:MAG: phosphotransferase family protein [Dehalococcoidia bacterium]
MTGVLDQESMEARFREWLKGKFPAAEELIVAPLQKSKGGFSNETYLFDLRIKERGRERLEKMVVRWEPQVYKAVQEYDLAKQYNVMKRLESTGVPVAKMYWLEEDRSILGSPFFVMQQVEGEVPPDRLRGEGLFYEATPARRTQLWNRAEEVVAKIHGLDWKKAGFSFLGVPKGGTDAIDQQIELYERLYNWTKRSPIPILDTALSWLKENRFEPDRLTLCWGDVRPSNMIYRDDQVVAVLDWEIAHIGDPIGDLAWFIVLEPFQGGTFGLAPLEGIPREEAVVQYYEDLTGTRVNNLFYHKVFALLRIACIVVQVSKNIEDAGLPGFPPHYDSNNPATQMLAEMLSR